MATVNINTIYPPIVESSIPAFLSMAAGLRISFTLPLTVNFNNVKHMAVRIVQQSNNKSVIDTDRYYDGIIYIANTNSNITVDNYGVYSLTVNRSDIKIADKTGWADNMFYKIQIRFGYNELDYTDRVSFFKWKKSQTSVSGYSEWSNVIITKSISEPRVDILNNLSTNIASSSIILNHSENVESTRFPEFQGGYSNVAEEPLDKYRFRLYEGKEVGEEYNSYLSTEWMQFNGSGNETYTALVKQVFNQPLQYMGDEYYTLVFDIITKNGYQCSSKPYIFTITEVYLKSLEYLSFIVKDNTNSGFYADKFYAPTRSVFRTYQRLAGLPIDAAYISFGDDGDFKNKEVFEQETGLKVKGTDIVYKDSKGYKILSLEERQNWAKSLDNDIFVDDNGCLRLYIKNNPVQKEVEKFDDLTGYHDWELTTVMQNLDGVYFISRASEKTNYTIWEDIARFEWFNEDAYNEQLTLLYEDYTVESGIKYKYAIQRQGVSGLRSAPKYELSDLSLSPAHQSNFQHCYVYCNGIQVKLDLDVKIQQFKHTRLFQKQDSLNSKYPIILRNGLANYGEFSLGAKITLHSDENTFFRKSVGYDFDPESKEQVYLGGYIYGNNIVIPAEKFCLSYDRYLRLEDIIQQSSTGYDNSIFDFNHTNNNVFMERIYREYVEAFLNDGGYKLYKSPTEGNMIVTFVNVSLVPNQQLGRLIADFNSTVYEVAENTVANMKLYNINPLDAISHNVVNEIGQFESAYRIVPGQVRGAFDGKYINSMSIPEDLYMEMLDKGLAPWRFFDKVKNEYITYEKLPSEIVNFIYLKSKDLHFSQKLNPYWDSEQDNIIEWIRQQEEIEISDEKKYQLNKVSQIWVELYPKYNIEQEIQNLKSITYDTKINKLKKQLQIAKYELMLKQYELSQSNVITMILNGKEITMFPGRVYQLDNVDIDSLYLKYTRPVLINYVAEIEEVDFLPKVTIEKQELANWGQVGGLFTTNQKILDNHEVERNPEILTVSEKYNYRLYQSLDIMDIIKEKTRQRIFDMYGITSEMTRNKLEETIDNFLKEENLLLMSYEEQVEEANKILKTYYPLSTIEQDSSTDVWMDSEGHYVIYHFDGLEAIEIEADENVEVIFNARDKYIDGEVTMTGDCTRTRVGPTNKFVLKTINRNIDQLRFAKPSYGIINYRAIASLEIKGLWQGNKSV